MAGNLRTELVVDLAGNLRERASRYSRSLSQLSQTGVRSFKALAAGTRLASEGIDKWGDRGVVVSGAIGYAFNRSFVRTASTFEKFESILNVVEGSSEKARKSMGWVTDFASTTPYELAEVTDAFVKLKAYGIDPQAGALKSAGDAAAAMGKPLEQAVEAMADAMTGENERLKEFGVTTQTKGNKIRYSWQQNGKEVTAIVNKNSKAQIQAQLEAIWNTKYGGAMDKLSHSWGGLTSNMSDQWTVFQKDVMASGAFDILKGQVGDLLGQLDEMKKTGEYDALVNTIGTGLVDAFKGVGDAALDAKEFGQGVVDVYEKMADLFKEVGSFVGVTNSADPAQPSASTGTREMTTAVVEFVAGVYLLNKTVRLMAPLAKGGSWAYGKIKGGDQGSEALPGGNGSLRGRSGAVPVYLVDGPMSELPGDYPGNAKKPKKPGKQKPRGGGKWGKFAPKGAGVVAVGMEALELAPMLMSDEVSTADKVQGATEAVGGAAGAWAGAAAGAALGSFIPIVGTAIGGLIGGALGYAGGEWAGEKAGKEITQKLDLNINLEGAPGTKADVTQMKASTDDLTANVYKGGGMR